MCPNKCLYDLAVGMWEWFQQYAGGPLLVGAVVAWIIPRANQRFQGRREHISKSVDTLRTQIDSLRSLTTSYWMTDFDSKTSPAQEGEIEFLLQDISGLVEVCVPYLWKKKRFFSGGNDSTRGPDLVSLLMLEVNGGTFGTKNRKAEPERIQRIANVAAEISKEIVAKRSHFLR
jgi:hypothetical protein